MWYNLHSLTRGVMIAAQDIVVANHGDDTAVWFENNANSGFFSQAHVIVSGANGAIAVAAVDVDNDGKVRTKTTQILPTLQQTNHYLRIQ